MAFLAILWALHGWIAWRVLPGLPLAPAMGLGAVLLASAAAIPSGFRRRRSRRGGATKVRGGGTSSRRLEAVRWVGLLMLGYFSSMLVLTLAREVVLLVAGPAWRDASAWVVVALAFAATAIGYAQARRTPRLLRVDVPIAGLDPAFDGFTIAQLSDIHVGPTIGRGFVESVVARVNGARPDLVAITGDLVDGSVAELAGDIAPLADLRFAEGTFFVTGNHEYYSGAAAWVQELHRIGLTVLANAHAVVERGGARLVVAGVNDYGAGHFDAAAASDPGAALLGSPSGATARVLLAHQPRSAGAAEAAGFDLQLSGHTHGGQFWPWNLFVRMQQPFTAGLHRLGRLWVYTSRGTGYWGPPTRFGAPSEITLLRLVPRAG